LVDGLIDTPVSLDFKEDDWVEIDLGRDRSIGEVVLFGKGDFWKRFDIMVYATGQKADEARMWCSEADWKWTSANRRDPAEGGFSVSYRSQSQRVRFIRLICRKATAHSELTEIRVTPIQVSQ
jgi:hypothetical protein